MDTPTAEKKTGFEEFFRQLETEMMDDRERMCLHISWGKDCADAEIKAFLITSSMKDWIVLMSYEQYAESASFTNFAEGDMDLLAPAIVEQAKRVWYNNKEK